MKRAWKWMMVIAATLAATIQQASAQTAPARPRPQPILLGTTGACNNVQPGGPCTLTSKLVQIDPQTGALIRTIGEVGYTVNGLAWDHTSRPPKLYASTAIGDVAFHGLITIDPATGAGTPVDPAVHNFGLPGADSPIHSIAIDPFFGTMQAWYDEVPGPGVTDTFVWINKRTGIAKEFPDSGIDTLQNGVAWQLLPTTIGKLTVQIPHLWNIDGARRQPDGTVTQTAYELNPLPFSTLFGKPVQRVLSSNVLSPPIMAALGDFNPVDHLYYGLNFQPTFDKLNPPPVQLVQVDPQSGNVTLLGQTVPGLHVIAFVK